MASSKQVAANKANSQKAGVKSEEGKAVVRFNSFKHGLTSGTLLAHISKLKETENLYLEILQGLRDSFQPRNFFEEQQIDLMAKALIKMRRCDLWESEQFKEESFNFDGNPKLEVSQIERVIRYRQAIENQYYRAMLTIQQARGPRQMDLFCSGGSYGD